MRHDTRVPLSRIAWLTTVVICLVATVLLLVSQYYGYAGVLAAVGPPRRSTCADVPPLTPWAVGERVAERPLDIRADARPRLG